MEDGSLVDVSDVNTLQWQHIYEPDEWQKYRNPKKGGFLLWHELIKGHVPPSGAYGLVHHPHAICRSDEVHREIRHDSRPREIAFEKIGINICRAADLVSNTLE